MICAVFAAFAVKIQVGETAYAAPTEELKTEVSAQSEEVSAQNAATLAAAWNSAVQESLDGNGKQVTFTLTENWTAQPDETYTTSFGSGVGFDRGRIYIPSGANIVLDLNGHTINRNLTSAIKFGGIMYINKSTFVLADNSTAKTGLITGANSKLDDDAVGDVTQEEKICFAMVGGIGVAESNFTLNGGKIDGNFAYDAGGLYLRDSNVVLNGGTVSNNTTRNTSGGISLSNCNTTINNITVTDNKAERYQGGGISVTDGTVTMWGGTISGNECGTEGSGIAVRLGALFTMNGGEIINNKPADGSFRWHNCGIGVGLDSTFILNDGKISGNTGAGGAGVLLTDNGTLEMNGGEISEKF